MVLGCVRVAQCSNSYFSAKCQLEQSGTCVVRVCVCMCLCVCVTDQGQGGPGQRWAHQPTGPTTGSTGTHTHTQTHTQTQSHKETYTYKHIHTRAHTHVQTHTCTHTHTHTQGTGVCTSLSCIGLGTTIHSGREAARRAGLLNGISNVVCVCVCATPIPQAHQDTLTSMRSQAAAAGDRFLGPTTLAPGHTLTATGSHTNTQYHTVTQWSREVTDTWGMNRSDDPTYMPGVPKVCVCVCVCVYLYL